MFPEIGAILDEKGLMLKKNSSFFIHAIELCPVDITFHPLVDQNVWEAFFH